MRQDERDLKEPRLIVLTGGSGVGKTTLIERLARLGYHTVPEAAMQVIGALNALLDDGGGNGPSRQLEWRCKHKAAFSDLLGAIAVTQEARAAAHPTSAYIFLDRSSLDNLGYAEVNGYTPPDFLTPAFRESFSARLYRVFVLDPVGTNREAVQARNEQTGRSPDPQGSKHVSDVMFKVYSELGCETHRLMDGSVDQRLADLLSICGISSHFERDCAA
ncbi:hypothetical protein AB1Y20_007559 [Prymnesium parvum]|uniref:NadR/Ttd14 AAA domain-containing protein n=1 Tax=Prymnesium parvum TaxID=97485 RepID=A0AB34IVJ8_PRYPA